MHPYISSCVYGNIPKKLFPKEPFSKRPVWKIFVLKTANPNKDFSKMSRFQKQSSIKWSLLKQVTSKLLWKSKAINKQITGNSD